MIRKTGFLLLLFSIITLFSCQNNTKEVSAVNGVLDLRSRNWELEGPLDLKGQWKYIGNIENSSFYDPEYDFSQWKNFSMPGHWHGPQEDPTGFYFFQLDILMNDQQNMAIYLNGSYTAFSLYIDGKEIISNGRAGNSKAETIPQQMPVWGEFENKEKISILLKVSNFDDVFGGLHHSPRIGLYSDLTKENYRKNFFYLVLLGILLIIGIHHFLFWLHRTKDLINLFFSFYCLSVAAYLFGFNFYLAQLFPIIKSFIFLFSVKMNYVSILLFCLFSPQFYKSLFPEEFSQKILLFFRYLDILLILFILSTPIHIYTRFLFLFIFLHFFLFIWVLLSLIKAKRQNKKYASLYILSYVITFIAITSDILEESNLYQSMAISPIGLPLAMAIQSFTLSEVFIRAFKKRRYLEKNLEEEVEHQTEQLNRQNNQLYSVLQELKESEEIRNTFFQNISHELRTPLTLILDPVKSINYRVKPSPPEKARPLFADIENKALSLYQDIEKLMDLTRIEISKSNERSKPLPVESDWKKWPDEDMKEKHDALILIIESDTNLRKEIVHFLEDRYMFLEAGNREEAESLLGKHAVDLILCAMQKDCRSVHDFMESVFQDEIRKTIPFIILSDSASHKNRIELLNMGVVDILDKPLQFNILRQKIEAFIRLRDKQKEQQKNQLERDIKKLISEKDMETDISPLLQNKALTEKERDIINLIMMAKSNQEIAEALNLSIVTVKNHISTIFYKMGISSREELIIQYGGGKR